MKYLYAALITLAACGSPAKPKASAPKPDSSHVKHPAKHPHKDKHGH